ncbi:hypothetical protein CXY01_08980 [Cellulomonas xylanilytica]|uniref:Uncharacterized protein n=1 Tax=Cellulomonas xylanilytica TaxID=233583 RepID=A0A510V0D1_9CELL|nr:hypothetical protein CXY01_08980 [Cellulomonas xylanilytica]
MLVVALALAGCSAGGPAPERSSTPTPVPSDLLAGVGVEVRQGRSTWAQRVVQVRVTNGGPGDLSVTGVRLTTPTVDGVAGTDKGRILRAGVDRDFSVALGDPVCDGAAGGAARAEVDLTDDAGGRSTIVVEPTDPQGHLARIHGEDCAGVAVAEGATLTLADAITTTDVGGTLAANVVLGVEPVAGGPRVEVTQVDRTVLFAPPGGAVSWPVTLDTASGEGQVVLPAVAGRCDLHAVADDKRGTFFGVHTRVDGVEQPVFYLASSEALRSALFEFIRTACGSPSSG